MVEAWMAAQRIDKIARETLVRKPMDKTSDIKPNDEQSEIATEAAVKEQHDGKRKDMDHFLESLGTRKDGLNGENAHRIFAIVVKIIPEP